MIYRHCISPVRDDMLVETIIQKDKNPVGMVQQFVVGGALLRKAKTPTTARRYIKIRFSTIFIFIAAFKLYDPYPHTAAHGAFVFAIAMRTGFICM